MTHTYFITGMTCNGCSDKVKTLLEATPGVTAASVDDTTGKAEVTMSRHLATANLQAALSAYPQYRLTETQRPIPDSGTSFWVTYRPILLVFTYLSGATILLEIASGGFEGMRWMRHFMAGFFLVFSFFKLLDLPGFAAAYQGYDEVAKRWPGWGRIYPFVELGLGILLLLSLFPLFTNLFTFILMGVGTLGVVRALRSKRPFQCACLGAVFNLPMSRITLLEDVLMVLMSGGMTAYYLGN